MKKHNERKSGWLYSFIIALIVFGLISTVLLLALPFGPYTTYDLIIGDKAIADTAVILIALSFFMGPLARLSKKIVPVLYLRKYLGVLGFGMAAMHAILALGLFEKSFFMDYQSGFLFGVLSFLIFAAVSVTSIPSVEATMHPQQWKFIQRIGYLALIFALLHFSVMKAQHWIPYFTNMTGLPSSSFIAFAFGVIVLIARLSVIPFGKPRK